MIAAAYAGTVTRDGATSDRQSEALLVKTHAELVKRIAYHIAARLPPSVDV